MNHQTLKLKNSLHTILNYLNSKTRLEYDSIYKIRDLSGHLSSLYQYLYFNKYIFSKWPYFYTHVESLIKLESNVKWNHRKTKWGTKLNYFGYINWSFLKIHLESKNIQDSAVKNLSELGQIFISNQLDYFFKQDFKNVQWKQITTNLFPLNQKDFQSNDCIIIVGTQKWFNDDLIFSNLQKNQSSEIQESVYFFKVEYQKILNFLDGINLKEDQESNSIQDKNFDAYKYGNFFLNSMLNDKSIESLGFIDINLELNLNGL